MIGYYGMSRSHRRVANAAARRRATAEPASAKQIAFLKRLTAERDFADLEVDFANLTKPKATRMIDLLLACPKAAPAAAPREHALPAQGTIEAGFYAVGGNVYKVVPARTSDRLYAKVMQITDNGGRWVYAAGAMRLIRAEHRMALAEATKFGKTHGFCVACGALLTDPESIDAGIGPVCATKF